MRLSFQPLADLEGLLGRLALRRIEQAAPVQHVRLNRPAKRNPVNNELLAQLHAAFIHLPADTRAAVLSGEGDRFCAGRAPGTPRSTRSSSAACR